MELQVWQALSTSYALGKRMYSLMGFPGGLDSRESACNTRDLDWIPGLGSYPGEGDGNPLQYSCLENSMERGVWWATEP